MRMTIGRKLLFQNTLAVLLTWGVGMVGYWGMTRVGERLGTILTTTEALRAQVVVDRLRLGLRGDLFWTILAADPADQRAAVETLDRDARALQAGLAALRPLALPVDVRAELDRVTPSLEAYLAAVQRIAASASTTPAAVSLRLDAFQRQAAALDGDLGAVADRIMQLAQEAVRGGTAVVEVSQQSILGFATATFVFLLLAAALLTRSVTRPINEMRTTLQAIAEGGGDLTRRLAVTGTDEVGELARSFNHFLDQVHDIVGQVAQTSHTVAAASQELALTANRLADGAQSQAASLEETAAALEEMTGTIKQNAEHADQASTLAIGSRDLAHAGGEVVSASVEAMNEINAAAKRIAEIITAIDELAFQTNLLALNAAVEAARAGDQGRGFAVVAVEVRNLAGRSAVAAKEIKGLIRDSVEKAAGGSQLVHRSGQTLHDIVASVKRVSDIVREIAAACAEQSIGVDQLSTAMTQMDQVTQTNATQTEQLATTAQSLVAQAVELQHLVGRFQLRPGTVAERPGVPSPPAVAPPPASPRRRTPPAPDLAYLERSFEDF